MSLLAFTSSIELGLIYALVSLGIFISYRILNIADLTVDGSFTLGAAVAAVMAINGSSVLGIILAVIAGGCAGLVAAFLQTKLKVQPILAGILTMTALYSINLEVMGGRANVSLLGTTTLFEAADTFISPYVGRLIVALVIVAVIAVCIVLFLNTQTGLSVRATGDNEDMVRSSSINPDFTKCIGLTIANALVALSGALLVHYQAFADVSMGIGMVVIGLASLIIGEIIFGKRSILNNVISVILGSIVYRAIIALALEINFSPSSLKLISALIVTLAISQPAIKEQIELYKHKKRGRADASHNRSL